MNHNFFLLNQNTESNSDIENNIEEPLLPKTNYNENVEKSLAINFCLLYASYFFSILLFIGFIYYLIKYII
uniref:Uncharacterized protein n=1 Tax=viral metagenome TaxID=1070528 RepID=A0A6C0EPN9_9ZZZZ